jgi:hypothetical protein
MFRPIRVGHTNCLQVAIKTHSFIVFASITVVIIKGRSPMKVSLIVTITGEGNRRTDVPTDVERILTVSKIG